MEKGWVSVEISLSVGDGGGGGGADLFWRCKNWSVFPIFYGDFIALLRSKLAVKSGWKKDGYRSRYRFLLVMVVEVAVLTFFGSAKTSPFP